VDHLENILNGKSPACRYARTLRIGRVNPLANNQADTPYVNGVREMVLGSYLDAIKALEALSFVV